MPYKKELAGSAKNGVAKNKIDSSEDRNAANNGIAELIGHIEVALAAVDFAGAPLERTDAAPPCLIAVPIVRCHASISYVRGHQALSIDLFWSGASSIASQDAGETVEWLQQAWFFSPNMMV